MTQVSQVINSGLEQSVTASREMQLDQLGLGTHHPHQSFQLIQGRVKNSSC